MWLWIILGALGVFVAIGGFFVLLSILGGPGLRPSFNFNLIYTRALRIEGDKQVAIKAALENLRTFLPPFVGLTDEQIAVTASLFHDSPDPKRDLRPVLTEAFKSGSLYPHFQPGNLEAYRRLLRTAK